MDSLIMKGKWNEVKGRLKKAYSQLTDDDLVYAEGREDELIGKIQQRTGANREDVMKLIKNSR